jgi:hypothetical protein
MYRTDAADVAPAATAAQQVKSAEVDRLCDIGFPLFAIVSMNLSGI